MKVKISLSMLFLFLGTTITFAQVIANDKSFKVITLSASKDTVFD